MEKLKNDIPLYISMGDQEASKKDQNPLKYPIFITHPSFSQVSNDQLMIDYHLFRNRSAIGILSFRRGPAQYSHSNLSQKINVGRWCNLLNPYAVVSYTCQTLWCRQGPS
jgi:hypothetical protein